MWRAVGRFQRSVHGPFGGPRIAPIDFLKVELFVPPLIERGLSLKTLSPASDMGPP